MSEEIQSLYEKIKQARQADGSLPEEFSLRPMAENGMRFADGAMDGTVRYHLGPMKNPDISGLCRVLTMASAGKFAEASNALLTHFSTGAIMLQVIDPLQEWIYDHTEELSPKQLLRFAQAILRQSPDIESVKFALTLLETMDNELTPEFREIIETLAISEEFTLFCLFVIDGWPDGAEVIFRLAQRLQGWGRIHAVSFLKPRNEVMRQWLLQVGWRNYVLSDYSAMTCIKRGKLLDQLQEEELSRQAFENARELIGCTLVEGPVPGMGKYKKAGELLEAYIRQAEKLAAEVEDYSSIYDIRAFLAASSLENKESLQAACDRLLESPACTEVTRQAVRQGHGFYFAKAMGMDYAEAAWQSLQRNFAENYGLIDLLLPEKLYVDEIMALFSDRLPLEDMASGPENELGFGEAFADFGILSYIVQTLHCLPGKGEKLILAALESPVIGCRNIALNTLDAWRKADYPLTPALQEELAKLREIEPDEKTKKRLEGF